MEAGGRFYRLLVFTKPDGTVFTFDEDGRAKKETTNSEWVIDEESLALQSRIGRNSDGEVVYNHYSGENASYYKYNSNGSPIVEDIDSGLKYAYTYNGYQELTKTEFDLYTVNYNNGNVESIYVNDTALISYDFSGENLNSETYANGQSLLYSYDANGNVTEVFSGAKTDENKLFSYTYAEATEDSETQKPLTVTDHKNNLKTYYTYAAYNEGDTEDETVTATVYNISGETETELFSYSANPGGTSLTLPDSAVTNSFTSEKTYTTVTDEESGTETQQESGSKSTTALSIDGVSGFQNINTNDLEGVLTGTQVKNGENTLVNRTFTYDEDSRITSESSNGTTISYAYDDSDNITSVSNGTLTVGYVYDSQNQLIRANDQFNNKTYVYEYDSRGNILSEKEYLYTTAEDLTTLTPAKTDSFTYYSNQGDNWQDELATFNGNSLTYDMGGNLTSYNGYTYTWEKGRQLKSISNGTNTYSYTYDANGIRTSKTVNGITTNYITDNGTILAEYTNNYVINYWYDDLYSPLGFVYTDKTISNPTTQAYIYTQNAQGDVTGILNSSGTQIVNYTYDSWGNVLSITGSLSITIGSINPIRYRGYYLDNETGHYYLQSRYYNPNWHRFINADDSRFIGLTGSVVSVNPFVYCENYPIYYQDKSGNVVDIFVDIAGACWSIYDLFTNPSWANAGFLAWDIAAIVIPFVPGSYVGKGVKAVTLVATKADDFVDGAEIVVDTYKNLRKFTKGKKNVHVHHLVEQRFEDLFKSKKSDFLSTPITPKLHSKITKKWRDLYEVDKYKFKKFKYGSDYTKITKEEMENAIEEVYKDMPQLKKKTLEWFRKDWDG